MLRNVSSVRSRTVTDVPPAADARPAMTRTGAPDRSRMTTASGSTGDASGGVARRRAGEEPTVRVEERDGFAGCVEPCFDGVAGETIRPSVALVGPPDEERRESAGPARTERRSIVIGSSDDRGGGAWWWRSGRRHRQRSDPGLVVGV
jgi:hypothetical protein